MMSKSSFKEVASAVIDGASSELWQVGKDIWENPELGFEEIKAHRILTNFLEKKGFHVERSYAGLETAFRASYGKGRPNLCVICEYDALPDLGHACGHNLIAEAGVAAGIGVKAAMEESPQLLQGTVTVLGTPAEETLGGKLNLIRSKAFEDMDMAVMVHPSPSSIVCPILLAMSMWEVTYEGKAAHAASYPWEGTNALDAVVLAYNFISALRQQMKPTWRVHGVILSGGGSDPAIIPAHAKLLFYMRTPHKQELVELEERVFNCFRAAATATGCVVDIKLRSPKFDHLSSNRLLASLYSQNLDSLGAVGVEMTKDMSMSTDFGNVSQLVPSLHPMYSIGNGGAVNHTVEFAALSGTPQAHKNTLTVAKAVAHTCLDIFSSSDLRAEIKRTFESGTT